MTEVEEKNEIVELSNTRHLENLQREQKQHEERIAEFPDLFARLEREEKSIMDRYDIMLKPENFKIIRPVWQYETLPEYVDTIRVDIENRRLKDEHELKDVRKQLDTGLKAQTEALESINAELARLAEE